MARHAADSESGAVDIRVLGPIEAWREGRPVALGGPRQRVLLALLLLERGRPVSAERMVEALWPAGPPEGASTTIRTYVSKLRADRRDGGDHQQWAGYAWSSRRTAST